MSKLKGLKAIRQALHDGRVAHEAAGWRTEGVSVPVSSGLNRECCSMYWKHAIIYTLF